MPQPNPAAITWIDRLVGYVSPAAGLRRFAARNALNHIAASVSPYEADTAGRTRKFYRDSFSPNQLTQKSAVAIRAQARQLQRNHDVSRGIIRTMVNNIVGPSGIGVEFQPRRADGTIHAEYAQALRNAWREHMLKPDVTRRHTGAKVQRLMCGTWLRDGEAFAQELIGTIPGLRHSTAVPLSLEMFEPDLVPFDHRVGDNTSQGIERNAWGQPTGYWVYKGHPGDSATATALKRIGAEFVHHIALLDRIGQMRGVSEFASIITRLEDIKDYEESERIAAKIAASLTAYVKKTSPDGYTGPNVDADGNPIARSIGMAPGMVIDNLAAGEEIGLIASDRPNPNLITYRSGQLRAVAAGVGASYSSIARDYNGTFSAQRQELVEQWVNYATLTDEFTGQFVQPWVSTFVKVAHISGTVPTPRDVIPGTEDDAMFLAQSMPWIDPAKEAAAWVALVRAGFASEVEVIRKRGGNPRDVLEQVSTWRQDAAAKNLVFNSNAAVAEQGGAPTAAPDPGNAPGSAAAASAQAASAAAAAVNQSQLDSIARTLAQQGNTLAQMATRDHPAPIVNNHITLPEQHHETHNHVAPAAVEVRNEVNVPETTVHVDNIVPATPVAEAPVINITNQVQPAPVTVNNSHPGRAIQTVERDASDEIVRTVTTYEAAKD